MSTKKNRVNTLNSFSVFSSYTEEILIGKHQAKIHSIFSNGFNLNFSGDLVYVSAYEKGMLSARGLALDNKVFVALQPYLTNGMQVRFRKNQLMFYARPHVLSVEFSKRAIKDLKIAPLSLEELNRADLKGYLEKMPLIDRSGFSKNENLLSVLKNIQKTKEITLHHINALIGAGLGLTPSGDDFLQGLIFTERLLKNPPHIQGMVEEQLKIRSTTDVSVSYYEAILAGYGNEPLILLIEAIREKNDQKIKQALSHIQKYGETSGYDLLTGILTYLQIMKDGMME